MNLPTKKYRKKIWKEGWEWINRWSSLLSLISYIKSFAIWIAVAILSLSLYSVNGQLADVQQRMATDEADNVLASYFYYIETGNHEKAWELFSDNKKKNSKDGFIGMEKWLEYFVAFEGLKIENIPEKNSATSKVYLAEFDFKKRGMKPVPTKMGFYMKLYGDEWKIEYTNTLYENGWKEGACEFYSKFPICGQK